MMASGLIRALRAIGRNVAVVVEIVPGNVRREQLRVHLARK